ncbi:MAG: outer membrane beta-barrel protein [Syntrophobacteraceae bacterium]|nr:outer membrane beta-barrel protein [Syntrophobacteraceae bacterium]
MDRGKWRGGLLRRSIFLILVGAIIYSGEMVSPCRSMADAEWRFTPSLNISGLYYDNYYSSLTNKTSTWSAQYAPGFALDALTGRSRLTMSYTANYNQYFGTRKATGATPSLDLSTQDYLGHNLNLYGATKFATRITAGLQEQFVQTREPGITDNLSNLVTREEYWMNTVAPFVTYDLGDRGALSAQYRNEQIMWSNTQNEPNSTENRGILTATYNLDNRNHVDLQGQYWHRDFSASNLLVLEVPYDNYQSSLIYRREMNSWLSGQAGAGYEWRYFDNSTVPNVGSPVFHLGVTGKTDRSSLNFAFDYGLVDYTIANQYFRAYKVGLTGEHHFGERLRAYMGGYYQISDYTNDFGRNDNTYYLNAGVGYSFCHKLLEVSLEYDRTNNDSNFPINNYADNVFMLRLTASYGLPRK